MSELIDVPESAIKLGVLLGLIRLASDGVHELTEKGQSYLDEWVASKLAEVRGGAV